jgi:hypothetical protein
MKDIPPANVDTTPPGRQNVFIVCEGNYGAGNASLYSYNKLKDSVFGDLYKSSNGGNTMGDVFENMYRINGYYVLVVNNSNKLLVLDTANFKLIKTISIQQPREILSVSNSLAYVSSMYSNKLYLLNTSSFTLQGNFPLASINPEGMCLDDNEAVVTCWDTSNSHLYTYSIVDNSLMHTINLPGAAPQAALVDKMGLLWVLGGDQPLGKNATLTRIDLSSGAIIKSYSFPGGADPFKPVMNNTKDTLYFIEAPYNDSASFNGIYRMSINADSLPAQPFIAAKAFQYYYALGIDPANGDIYVGDPRGFVEAGLVDVFHADGTLVRQFKVGLGPGHFYFNQ